MDDVISDLQLFEILDLIEQFSYYSIWS